ncbi:MAG TPA: four helix bundle protein, partial [Kofleriaceae bacterium]|nr:four helix bundle protein [Kofleriaceae bacterium]
RSLAEQIHRAACSVPSNIDEANGLAGGRRIEHFRYALGSAREVTTQLRLAQAFGYVDDIASPLALLDRVRAMLWRLTR